VAAKLDVGQVSDITKVISADTFERPIYAGNAIATVQSSDATKVLTVRTTGFDPAAASGGSAPVEVLAAVPATPSVQFVRSEIAKMDRPELTGGQDHRLGGRALGSNEKFMEVMTPLADKLGAAMGASRAAVDAGYAPNDWQVGQTGKIVAPQLYVAVRHQRGHPAPGGHEGQQGDRGHQQGRRGPDLQRGRLRAGGGLVYRRASLGGGVVGAAPGRLGRAHNGHAGGLCLP